jgi:hypothetical protein
MAIILDCVHHCTTRSMMDFTAAVAVMADNIAMRMMMMRNCIMQI